MNPLVQILGWALIHSLWQVCLLVILAAIASPLLSAKPRHAVNGLILALCLGLPMATALSFHAPTFRTFEPTLIEVQGLDSSPRNLSRATPRPMPLLTRFQVAIQPRLPFLVVLWAMGAALMGLRLGGGFALSLRWRQRALPAAPEWQKRLDALGQRLNLRRQVHLLVTKHGNTPMTLGLWKPVVLFPAALLSGMPISYLEALLAHELAHVQRQDYLSNLLQSIAETLLFFHPAIWWLSSKIRAEREELSDQLAAQMLGDSRELALALDSLDDFQATHNQPLFPALAARGGRLSNRIEHLLSPKPVRTSPWGLLTLILIPCMVVALRAAVPEPPPIGAPSKILAKLDALAIKEGVDPQLLRSMAWVESGMNPSARSPVGATGLLQVLPETARAYGAKDLSDQDQVMAAGAKYLHFLLDRYQGDVSKAVAAYNCGERALEEGRITEEATRYRSLVLDVLAAKAVQPEAPLADGDVQGVLRRQGNKVTIRFRIRAQGNLKLNILPADKSGEAGQINIGELKSEATGDPAKPYRYSTPPRAWEDMQPTIMMDVAKAGGSLLVHAEDPGNGWKGEARILLDSRWKTFAFRMEKPKS